jgi:hypothetical protein
MLNPPADPVGQLSTLWTRFRPCGSGDDPLDQQNGFWGGQPVKRSCSLWMSEGPMFLQLDPLDHPFDPEGQAPTLWVRTN